MAGQLASLLRMARIEAGLTLRAVESETGISNAYLSQLETGKAENPSPAHLLKLAELYEFPLAELHAAAGYAPAPKELRRDIFISHSSKDKNIVRELAAEIEA